MVALCRASSPPQPGDDGSRDPSIYAGRTSPSKTYCRFA